jgi:hypothetical protein
LAALLAVPLHAWTDLQWQPASPGGGEKFAMYGGIPASAAYLATKIYSCPVFPQLGLIPPPPKIPPKNVSPAPTMGWIATNCWKAGVPDTQIAVSSSHVVVSVNDSMGWYDRSGVQQGQLKVVDLFEPLLDALAQSAGGGFCVNGQPQNQPCVAEQGDFRIIYDEFRKRFWAADTGAFHNINGDPNKYRGIIMLAVSQTEDPKDGWYLYWWDAVAHWGAVNDAVYQPGDGADYPCIGIDSFGFYQTITVGHLNGGGYQHVVIFPAWDNKLINGMPVDGRHFFDLEPAGGDIQPVMHHGWGGNTYFVSRYVTPTDDEVVVWSMDNSIQPANMWRAEVKLNAFDDSCFKVPPQQSIAPCDASQLNSPWKIEIQNAGTNILKAVYRDGELAFVATDARDWFGDQNPLSSIRLVRLWLLGGDPAIAQSLNLDYTFGKNSWDDNPTDRMSYGWPALEMNKYHKVAVVSVKSGTTIHPQVRYSAHFQSESATRPSQLLKLGEATYAPNGCGYNPNGRPMPCRFADLAGAAVDPQDDTGIWLAQESVNASGGYDIWVAKVF